MQSSHCFSKIGIAHILFRQSPCMISLPIQRKPVSSQRSRKQFIVGIMGRFSPNWRPYPSSALSPAALPGTEWRSQTADDLHAGRSPLILILRPFKSDILSFHTYFLKSHSVDPVVHVISHAILQHCRQMVQNRIFLATIPPPVRRAGFRR